MVEAQIALLGRFEVRLDGRDVPADVDAALAAYGGRLLPDDVLEPWTAAEREHLQQLHVQVLRAGRGTTALVSGLPGAGMSSVLARVRARARHQGARVGAGDASAAAGGWPYAPVLEGLADLCHLHPALLTELDDAYRREIERALRGGEPWSGDGSHQRLFIAVAELLRLAAAGTGAVLTVDDLAEADDMGDVAGAHRHLRAAERCAALWHGTAWHGALLEARAHRAHAEGEDEAGRRLLREAALCFEGAGQPLAARCRAADPTLAAAVTSGPVGGPGP